MIIDPEQLEAVVRGSAQRGPLSGCVSVRSEELIITDFENCNVAIGWSDLETPSDYLPLFQHERMKFTAGERFAYSNRGVCSSRNCDRSECYALVAFTES